MMKEETTYHIPVLLMPSVDAMNIRPDGTYAVSYTHLTLPTTPYV